MHRAFGIFILYSRCVTFYSIIEPSGSARSFALTNNQPASMWIFFGVVSFSVILSYQLWRKLHWALGWPDDKGYLKTTSGQTYKHGASIQGAQSSFHYAVLCAPGTSFRIHRETRRDRIFKKIGLSVERQFNDLAFDDTLYVASNSELFLDELADTEALRKVIRLLFSDSRLKRLDCHGQHVIARYTGNSTTGTLEKPDVVVAALRALADSVSDLKNRTTTRWDRYAFRAALLVALSSACLTLGLLESFRIGFWEHSRIMLSALDLFIFSSQCALLVLVSMLILTAAWLRGSSYAHIVMAEVLISGGIGLTLSSYALARDVNTFFDESQIQQITTQITGKRTWRGRKSGTHYELSLASTPSNTDIPRNIEVSYALYHQADTNKNIVLSIRDGALGYQWIESYEITP